jgi:hypothetical protein
MASRCHRRFKQDFLGIGNNGKGNERQANTANTATHGHMPSYPIDPAWYMDTGATSHLTSEMDKLAVCESYRGHEKVHTTSGEGMHISHIGHTSLLSKSSKQLHLKNILRVPLVTRSLLSVPKLTMIIMCLLNFTPGIFLLRTGPRGTFFLEVAIAMAYMNLMRHLSPKSSVMSVSRRHNGTPALAI